MCNRFKLALEKLDFENKIEYVSLHEDTIYEKFPQLSKQKCNDTIHLLTETDEVLKGARVLEYLVKLFPGVNKLAWLLETESGQKAMDFFYERLQTIRKSSKWPCPKCDQNK